MANYFSILLVILTLGSGLIWLLDAVYFGPKRRDRSNAVAGFGESALQPDDKLPYLVDTAQQIFPVIAFVLVLRSFLYEPFQIPSGSMMPTLLVGDFILVEKYAYGLKDPVFRHKFIETGAPERGDVVVFKYPEDPNVDFIKRVVGLPGDTVIYRDKKIYIKPACASGAKCDEFTVMPQEFVSSGEFVQHLTPLRRMTEQLGKVPHDILQHPTGEASPREFFTQPGTKMNEWIVPEGQYFVLGDNRDNSRDSRFWGFVPDENLVGKAVAIWISFEFDRPASSWVPSWIPSGVRFSRVGGIQ